jgi:hypothetical protein
MIFAAYVCYQRIICYIIGAAPLDIASEKIIKYFEFIERHKILTILGKFVFLVIMVTMLRYCLSFGAVY